MLGSVRLTPDRGLGVQSWKLCDSLLKALVVLGDAFVRRPVQIAGLVPVGCCPGRNAGRISSCGSWLLVRLLCPCGTACGIVSEHVVATCRDTPFWHAVFKTEHEFPGVRAWIATVGVAPMCGSCILP